MIARAKTVLSNDTTFIKVVIDIERRIASFGCELHTDCYEELVKDGSRPKNLWGANLYPNDERKIDFVSMINIRPADDNRSMEIQNPQIQSKVEEIIKQLFF